MIKYIERLYECDGTKCTKCGVVYYDKRVNKCNQCHNPTEPAKYYSRTCVERVAFIATLALIVAIATIFISDNFGACVLALFMVPAMYFTANYFFGIGGLTEVFSEDSIPSYAKLNFSWPKYFSEAFSAIKIAIALLLLGLVIRLLR